MKHRLVGTIGLFLGLSAAVVACSGDDSTNGGGPNGGDGGASDAGSGNDATSGSDSGGGTDAGGGTDSGSGGDSGTGSDGGGPTITVSGGAYTQFGAPIPNAPVIIEGGPVALTDSVGHFTLTGVHVPYTIDVVVTPGVGAPFVASYQEMTRPDPKLVVLTYRGNIQSSSQSMSGTLSGATFPEAANTTTLVQFVSPTAEGPGNGSTSGSDNHFSISDGSFSWSDQASVSGSAYFLQYQHAPSGTEPTVYNAWGKLAVPTVLDDSNGDLALGNVALAGSITSSTLTANINLPAGYHVQEREVSLSVDGVNVSLPAEDSPAAAAISYTTPNISGTKITLLVGGTDTGNADNNVAIKGQLDANATGVALTLYDAPKLIVPVRGATGVTADTEFQWTAYAGGGVSALVVSGSDPSVPTYLIHTASTHAKIPDLTVVGLPVPKNASFTWTVLGIGPAHTVDEAFGTRTSLFDGTVTDLNLAATNLAHAFTTAP